MQRNKSVNKFWKITSSWVFWLVFYASLLTIVIVVIRETVSKTMINMVLEGVIFAVIFPSAWVLKVASLMHWGVQVDELFYIVPIAGLIYYWSIMLIVALGLNGKYAKVLIILMIIWSLASAFVLPGIAPSLAFD